MSLSVAVLITNYETWPDAAQCARKVIEHCGNQVSRILIVDDASSDPAPSLPDQVEVRRHETNLGFPATLNNGFETLTEEVVVYFDADSHPLMDFIPRVTAAFSENEQLGALGFHLVDRNGRPTESYVTESSISVFQFLIGQRLSGMLKEDGKEGVLLPITPGTAIRREALLSVGGFDEGFELLDVDLDFFLRLAKAGWDVRYDSEIRAFHEGGGTPQTTSTRVVRHHRDRWRLLWKHDKIKFPLAAKGVLLFRHFIEYSFLKTIGSLITQTERERRDKVKGWRMLLRRVWNEYR